VLSEGHIINHGFRHGWSLLPTIFNTYINEILVKLKHIYTKVINLSTSTKRNTSIFADDHVIIADSDNNLLGGGGGGFQIKKKSKKVGMKITQKKF